MVKKQISCPCEKFGNTIAIRLAKELFYSCDRFAEEILEKLSGIYIARASKNGMMLVLYGASSLIIRIKAIKLGSIKAWVDDSVVTQLWDVWACFQVNARLELLWT